MKHFSFYSMHFMLFILCYVFHAMHSMLCILCCVLYSMHYILTIIFCAYCLHIIVWISLYVFYCLHFLFRVLFHTLHNANNTVTSSFHASFYHLILIDIDRETDWQTDIATYRAAILAKNAIFMKKLLYSSIYFRFYNLLKKKSRISVFNYSFFHLCTHLDRACTLLQPIKYICTWARTSIDFCIANSIVWQSIL